MLPAAAHHRRTCRLLLLLWQDNFRRRVFDIKIVGDAKQMLS